MRVVSCTSHSIWATKAFGAGLGGITDASLDASLDTGLDTGLDAGLDTGLDVPFTEPQPEPYSKGSHTCCCLPCLSLPRTSLLTRRSVTLHSPRAQHPCTPVPLYPWGSEDGRR